MPKSEKVPPVTVIRLTEDEMKTPGEWKRIAERLRSGEILVLQYVGKENSDA